MPWHLDLRLGEHGLWTAAIDELEILVHGSTLGRCRQGIRAELRTRGLEDAVSESFTLPDDVRDAIERRVAQLDALEQAAGVYDRMTTEAITLLRTEYGRGLRDTAAVLGMTHQNIHQIIRGQSRKRPGRDLRAVSSRIPRRRRRRKLRQT